MAEHLHLGPVNKQYRRNHDAAAQLERDARAKVGYLFDSMMSGQTFKSGSWNLGNDQKINAYVWNDMLGKRATVRLDAPFIEQELEEHIPEYRGFMYCPSDNTAPYGWGIPYITTNGLLINPPLGSVLTSIEDPRSQQYRRAEKNNTGTWQVYHQQTAIGGSRWKKIGNNVLSWNGPPGWEEMPQKGPVNKKITSCPIWYLGTLLCGYPDTPDGYDYSLLAVSWTKKENTEYIYILVRNQDNNTYKICRKIVNFKKHKVSSEWECSPAQHFPAPKEDWACSIAGMTTSCNEATLLAAAPKMWDTSWLLSAIKRIYKVTWPEDLSSLTFSLMENSEDTIKEGGAIPKETLVETMVPWVEPANPFTYVTSYCGGLQREIDGERVDLLSYRGTTQRDWTGEMTMPIALDYNSNDELQVFRIKAKYTYKKTDIDDSYVTYAITGTYDHPMEGPQPILAQVAYYHDYYYNSEKFTDITLTLNDRQLKTKQIYKEIDHFSRTNQAEWITSPRVVGTGSDISSSSYESSWLMPMITQLNPREGGWMFIESGGKWSTKSSSSSSSKWNEPNHQCQCMDYANFSEVQKGLNETEKIEFKNNSNFEWNSTNYHPRIEEPAYFNLYLPSIEYLFNSIQGFHHDPEENLLPYPMWAEAMINLICHITLNSNEIYNSINRMLWMPDGQVAGNIWWSVYPGTYPVSYISIPIWSEGNLLALTGISEGVNPSININPDKAQPTLGFIG